MHFDVFKCEGYACIGGITVDFQHTNFQFLPHVG